MTIRQLLPSRQDCDFADWLNTRRASRNALLRPFQKEVLDFCSQLSQLLFRDAEARAFPELQALAFWMRRAELQRLAQQQSQTTHDNVLRMPRGLVFHVPPANVQTIFVYSWLVSILAGNRNIIRLSRRDSPQSSILIRLFAQALTTAPAAIAESSCIVQYGHDPEITAALSSLCDLRVIWGGDQTVEEVRKAPLQPHARDLTFPDRYSLATLHAETVAGLDDANLATLAGHFYNDTFWFDQMACSSPRLLIWCGGEEACRQAATRFLPALEQHLASRDYDAGPASHINKFTFGCRAVLDGHAVRYHEHGPLSVLDGVQLDSLPRDHCGGGLLYEFRVDSLAAIQSFVTRREQTLTHFGFARQDLLALATALNGAGIDRMVPVGQALQFQRNWDGYDLLREMTREVYCLC